VISIQKAGATPNLLKYIISADAQGGELLIDQASLLRDAARGPLRNFVEQTRNLTDDQDACQRLLCNPSTRVFVTPRTLARLAVDARALKGALALYVTAEPNAVGIIALEFRHSVSA